MAEISIYSEQMVTEVSELFSSPHHNSASVVMAPGHRQPPHRGIRRELCFDGPFGEPVVALLGDGYSSDDIVVRSFPNAVVSRDFGVVKDANSDFVAETLSAFRFQVPGVGDPASYDLYNLPPESSLHGNYVYATHGNYIVFSHFLFETVCSVYLLRSLFSIGLVSLIVPDCESEWPDGLLDFLEIPRCSRYRLADRRVRVSNLILSSTCSVSNTFRPHVVMRDVAKHFLDTWGDRSGKRTRLYLTREGSPNTQKREYADEAAVSSMLKELGFVTLNPATLPFEEQVRLFSTAEIVVGVHGSAFANLIFAPVGCKVVDIVHDTWAPHGGCFTTNLTNLFEQEYVYLIAKASKIEGGESLSLDPEIVYDRVKRFLQG